MKKHKTNGCVWCTGDWTDKFSVYDEDFGLPLTYRHIKYCPFCGRKLDDKKED